MAVRFNSIGEGLVRTSGSFLAGSTDFTVMFKARITSRIESPSYRTFWVLGDGNLTSNYVAVYDSGDVGELEADAASTVNQETNGPYTVARWYDVIVTYDNTAKLLRFFLDNWLIGSAQTLDLNAAALSGERLGYDLTGSAQTNVDIAYYRSWSTILTLDEVEAERISASAVKAANLFCDTPLVSDLLDDSGNGRNWTAVGSTSFVSGPTLESTAPTNTTALTAELLVDEATIIKTAANAGVNPELWYKYTPSGDTVLITLFAFGQEGAAATNYNARVDVYNGPASAPVSFNSMNATNEPIMVHVPVAGAEYLFKITTSTPTIDPAVLNLYFEVGPNTAAPAGTIFVPADLNLNWPAIKIDRTTKQVIGAVVPFAGGEAGDVLDSNGSMLIAAGSQTKLYSSTFTLLATLSINSDNSRDLIRANQVSGKFYVLGNEAPPVTVYRVTQDGVVEATWDVSGAPGFVSRAIAPHTDDTKFYWGGTSSEVRVWDTVNNVALSNLASAVAGQNLASILCLADDIILVQYWKTVPDGSYTVRRYNSSGTLLNTYTLEGNADRLASHPSDTTSFWGWSKVDGERGLFLRIRISDGVELERIDVPEGSSGVPHADPTPTPRAMFFNDDSCPFFLLREASTPEPPGPVPNAFGGIYFIDPGKREDTLYSSFGPPIVTLNRKIP